MRDLIGRYQPTMRVVLGENRARWSAVRPVLATILAAASSNKGVSV